MTTKTTRFVDNQGRIIIPNHIRKALNLNKGSVVEVDLAEDGTIRLRASTENCTFCGESLEGKHFVTITNGKHICAACAEKIARAMMKA